MQGRICPKIETRVSGYFRKVSKHAFSALTLLVGRQEGHPACKKLSGWWSPGTVICLERNADLHTAQLRPLPLTVSCSSIKIQIGFTFLVPAHLGSPGQRAVKRMYVCMNVPKGIKSIHSYTSVSSGAGSLSTVGAVTTTSGGPTGVADSDRSSS